MLRGKGRFIMFVFFSVPVCSVCITIGRIAWSKSMKGERHFVFVVSMHLNIATHEKEPKAHVKVLERGEKLVTQRSFLSLRQIWTP